MGILKFFIKKLNTDEKILLERHNSSKVIFIICSFVFALTFYMIGAGFNDELFIPLFTYSYVLTLFSLLYYLYFTIKLRLFGYFSSIAFVAVFALMAIIALFFIRFVS